MTTGSGGSCWRNSSASCWPGLELVAVVVEPELVVEEAEAIGFSSPRDSSLRLGNVTDNFVTVRWGRKSEQISFEGVMSG